MEYFTSVFSVFAFFVFIFFLFYSFFNFFFPNRGKIPLPPGSMGCPYIGETFQLYSQNANVSFASKQKSYGTVFKTHISCCPYMMISRPAYPPWAYPPPPGGYTLSPRGYTPHGYAPRQGYPPAGYPGASQSGHGGVGAMIAGGPAAASATYGARHFVHGAPHTGHGGRTPWEAQEHGGKFEDGKHGSDVPSNS